MDAFLGFLLGVVVGTTITGCFIAWVIEKETK